MIRLWSTTSQGPTRFAGISTHSTFLAPLCASGKMPVPDITTENGRRLLTVHIDGDGFPSRAEILGTPLAGRVLLDEFVSRYRIPHAISVIEAEIAPHGLYPGNAAEMEDIARRIFAHARSRSPAIHSRTRSVGTTPSNTVFSSKQKRTKSIICRFPDTPSICNVKSSGRWITSATDSPPRGSLFAYCSGAEIPHPV